MHLQTAPLDGDFNAASELHPDLVGHCTCCCQTIEIIVIGQRQEFDAIGGRTPGNFVRRKQAVRRFGMAMEINIEHVKEGLIRKKSSRR